jgi:hypothetical protein
MHVRVAPRPESSQTGVWEAKDSGGLGNVELMRDAFVS